MCMISILIIYDVFVLQMPSSQELFDEKVSFNVALDILNDVDDEEGENIVEEKNRKKDGK